MKHFILAIILLTSTIATTLTHANAITLYDQPNTTAKTIGTIDSEAGIIPIFTPKTGDWIKVGDPRNGNVGWIKSSDLHTAGNNGFSFSEHVISNGNGPSSYIIQFGTPKSLSNDQINNYVKQMQQRNQAMQKEMQHMMKDMFNNFDQYMMHFPIIMPVVFVPQDTAPAAKKTAQPAAATPPATTSKPPTSTPTTK